LKTKRDDPFDDNRCVRPRPQVVDLIRRWTRKAALRCITYE